VIAEAFELVRRMSAYAAGGKEQAGKDILFRHSSEFAGRMSPLSDSCKRPKIWRYYRIFSTDRRGQQDVNGIFKCNKVWHLRNNFMDYIFYVLCSVFCVLWL
jgi:hypothetical protein